jgi:hypothetical protein
MRGIAYILFAILFYIGFQATGQNLPSNAVGLRAGPGSGITFQHKLSNKTGVELIAATRYAGLSLTGLYEIHAQAFDVKNLNWYYGGGAHLGWYGRWPTGIYDRGRYYTGQGILGLDGIVGMEYIIQEIPIMFSLDWKPSFHLIGPFPLVFDEVAVSVRYTF